MKQNKEQEIEKLFDNLKNDLCKTIDNLKKSIMPAIQKENLKYEEILKMIQQKFNLDEIKKDLEDFVASKLS